MYNFSKDTYTITYKLYAHKIFILRQLAFKFKDNVILPSGRTMKQVHMFCNNMIMVNVKTGGVPTIEISKALIDELNNIYSELRKVASEQNLI